MSGIKAQIEISAGVESLVYTVPEGFVGVYKIIVRNKSNLAATVELFYTKDTTSESKKTWHEMFERAFSVSGEILEGGQKIIIKTNKDAVVTAMGMEEAV